MATFSPDVSPYKRRDGTYLIKVRITQNRKTIRKPLGIYATTDQLNRERTRVRDKALLSSIDASIGRLRLVASRIDGAEFMDVATLWTVIQARMEAEKGFTLDFFAFADEVVSRKEKGTADGYKYALTAFKKYLGKDAIDINAIDKSVVDGFREWIEKRNGRGCRAASAYLEKLRHIHNEAKARYNDDDTGLVRIPRSPFKKGTIPAQPETKHKALSVKELKKVFSVIPTTARGRLALDVFRLQFFLLGMDTADLYKLKKGDLRDGVLIYNRAKTDSRRQDHAEFRVRVEPEAAAIIHAHNGVKGLMSFADRYATFKEFNRSMNIGLKEVAKLAGLPTLATKWARHTWATIARNDCDISKDTVAECLNHAGSTVTDVYLARDWSRLWAVNRRVLDFVFEKN